jgi:hypothetical protein
MLEADRTHLRREPRSQLGDLSPRGAENSLAMGLEIEYPGDDQFLAEAGTPFLFYRDSDTHHLIMENLFGGEIMMESTMLADLNFNLQRWISPGLSIPRISHGEWTSMMPIMI